MWLRIFLICTLTLFFGYCSPNAHSQGTGKTVRLPKPSHKGGMSVEEAIFNRRSVRDFMDSPVSLKDISQILWAAGGKSIDGMTGPTRAYPSAGAIYPLEIYLVAGKVSGLEPGIYYYEWRKHQLELVKKGDFRKDLAKAALSQKMIQDAPATLVITAQYAKTLRKYGKRGMERYVGMDTGHLGQNVHLQAESMGLGTVMVGAFIDRDVQAIVGAENELPIYMMPIGEPK